MHIPSGGVPHIKLAAKSSPPPNCSSGMMLLNVKSRTKKEMGACRCPFPPPVEKVTVVQGELGSQFYTKEYRSDLSLATFCENCYFPHDTGVNLKNCNFSQDPTHEAH